ncbi:MAG: aminotransferase class V-fold PLP-dependent enzyme [Bacteroidetes bacterium]|jgi:selenocysteine lyase/cysteine desulfurase|nr:aminotransferase class V-fold PLP-dependent enzyme [Bacteroidota bacterium]MBT5528140.1 aminotransferase class V-fold PLP-dependent enzyme [Cytophagia bacterium]MBT3802824.1 aminotransferase class V-fold PLP-dependent enzyme [Bacteroidota bacterium]MBT3935504.1 aminotransferase class V-fold PLP-dependent enzyme [Bacteroidota bacterium]MBT4728176.1 aminotransferase class V-fold PLP-dependent enzyme [Bacteroidota bacterium]
MYKKYYKSFLEANKGKQHFACHSHYYWPDVTRQAMLDYWDDSAKYVDAKWAYFYQHKIPKVQSYIAQILNLDHPEQIVFAPNTHEFILRILSCFDNSKQVNILTTNSEFYSFSRQIDRLSELDNFQIDRIEFDSFDTFEERFIQAAQKKKYDLIFFSQVFFNSGIPIRSLDAIVNALASSESIIVIDGYHGFRSVLTDLKNIQDKAFYMAGSYKYAQGGEGCCFMHVPKGNIMRPINTGWFADLATLGQEKNKQVQYADDGNRFAGSTMDFSSLYRLLSVFALFEKEGIDQNSIRTHIQKMQTAFLEEVAKYDHPLINKNNLLLDDLNKHGHFLTFKLENAEQVSKMAQLLNEHDIITDYRGDRLRFGFALYHDGQYDLSVLNTRRAYFFDELIF